MGISGCSAASLLLDEGAEVLGLDAKIAALQENSEVLALKQKGLRTQLETEPLNLKDFDCLILSPGVPRTNPIYQRALEEKLETYGEIELGCRCIKNPILGITGTNGKTTVTLLTTHILNSCGIKAKAVGNVGLPLTQEVKGLDPDTVLVLELSSFQLETLSQPVLDGGVILNITPDHLDRYSGMEEYALAKIRMENCLKANAPLYVEEQTLEKYRHLFSSKEIASYGYSPKSDLITDLHAIYLKGCKLGILEGGLKGKKSHDLENILAAFALCRLKNVDFRDFMSHLPSFIKPPHRIEFIASKNGISYYDDSKGTNIDAVIRAVESLPGPVILIAGGVDKGAAYTPWIDVFKGKVKGICAIGQAAPLIRSHVTEHIPVVMCPDLEQAVLLSTALAEPGDQILLSPGCSSYDMFKDYKHRGKAFQDIVKSLL